MDAWIVDNGYSIDFNDAPVWAVKVAWVREGHPLDGTLHRVWVDKNNTRYKYLRGFGNLSNYGVTLYGNFFELDYGNPVRVCAWLTSYADEIPDPEPMVCHDQYGFMTDEFRRYSQRDWDKMRDEVKAIIRMAIQNGVSPIAMKDLLTTAVDCGTTLAMAEAKVEGSRK